MVRLLTWNCNGLSDERKISFLRSNFNDLKGVNFAPLVEAHLSDLVHNYREPNDSHAGLCFVISKNYIIRETKYLMEEWENF